MEIRKRNGEMAAFDAEKIRAVMRLAFTATNVEITEQSLNSLLRAVVDGGGILRDCKGIHPVQGKAGEGSRDAGADCSAHGRSFVGGNIA